MILLRIYPVHFKLFLVFVLCHQFQRHETRIADHHMRDRIYRSWSEWSSWSSCSRSCGVGVAVRTRICKTRLEYLPITLPKTCAGENLEHKLCDQQKCPSSAMEFVSYQCSLHNGQLIGGKMIIEWIPYKRNDNPCELQCQAKDGSLLYSFGKVIDGTECSSKHQAICVNGRCTKIDCSGQLGMDGQLDICGVCRGDNSTCVRYQNSYWGRPRRKNSNGAASATDQHYDYNHIARIPSGVTKILIRESSETNFLALMDKVGKIVINNNWRVASPGLFNTSGTEFTYSRLSTGEDTLSAPGPTESDLFILVLGKEDIPTVEYEYWYSKKSSQNYLDSRKKNISDRKVPSAALVLSAQRNKNALGYEGYRSYYHRNEIIPSHYETKLGHDDLSQHSTTTSNVVHHNNIEVKPTSITLYFISTSATTPLAPNRIVDGTVSPEASQMKSRHPLVSTLSSSTALDESDEARIGVAKPHHGSASPPEASPDARSLRSKDAYLSNAVSPAVYSLVYSNETSQGKSKDTVLVSSSRTTSRYPTLPKLTHENRRIPPDLKKHHYEIDSFLRNSSSAELNFLAAQLCTKRHDTRKEFLTQHRKRQRAEIYSSTLEMPRRKETMEFLPVSRLMYTRKKSDHRDNGKVRSYRKEVSDMKSKKKKRKKKSSKGQCLPCRKVKQQTKNFCKSDFVLRIVLTSTREVKGETQFEIQVIQSYMNKIPILSREYLWRLDPCRCPRLLLGREYIVMGHLDESTTRNRESRLYVNGESFVRRYGQKRALSVLRLARDKGTICKKFKSSEE